MNYKKIIRDNYTLHVLDTDRFKSLDIVIYFTKKYEKKNRALNNLLVQNLVYSSKKYNTKNKISIKSEELYGMSVSAFNENLGALENISIHSNFLNPKYTEDKYYYESIDFLFEVLCNPNVKDNKFDSKFYNIIKNDTISNINAKKDNPNRYASAEFNKIMYKGIPKANETMPTIKEVNIVNEESLYEFYKTLFEGNYKIDVFVLGEIKEDSINYLENKLSVFKGNNKPLNIFVKPKYEDKIIEKIDTLHFNQSKLYMGYKLIDLTDYELKYVSKVYNTILGTMNNSILFSIVRENNSLCYSIGSFCATYSKSLVIYAGINRNNYEKTVKLIKECVNSMNDINVITKMIKPAKKTINTFLNGYYDDAVAQINNKFINEFDTIDDIETKREKLNNVTEEEIIALNNKIKLSVIYLLKGDN